MSIAHRMGGSRIGGPREPIAARSERSCPFTAALARSKRSWLGNRLADFEEPSHFKQGGENAAAIPGRVVHVERTRMRRAN